MDVVTQAVIGAAAGQGLMGRRLPRSAWMIGAVAGYLPDADIFISFRDDTLSTWLIHRHFSHGVGFLPIGALLVMGLATLVWLVVRGRLDWWAVWWAALAGIATHGVLDACTSFGTMLWWPFSSARVGWDLVAIIDPLVTLPLFALTAWSVWKGWRTRGERSERTGARRWAVVGLVWSVVYVGGLGLVQRERAMATLEDVARRQGHTIARDAHGRLMARVLMAPAQNFVFRGVYVAEEGEGVVNERRVFVVGLRVPWWGTERTVMPGRVSARLIGLDDPMLAAGSISEGARRDAARFIEFADGWVVAHPDHPDALADARYGLLIEPGDGFASLWWLGLSDRALAGSGESALSAGEVSRLVRNMDLLGPRRARIIEVILGRHAAYGPVERVGVFEGDGAGGTR
jgi:inner membrane protein